MILPVLYGQTKKERAVAGSGSGSGSRLGQVGGVTGTAPLSGGNSTSSSSQRPAKAFFHPHYLTPPNLLPYELADPSFRRQILVQFCILFQFLLLISPPPPGNEDPSSTSNSTTGTGINPAKGKGRTVPSEPFIPKPQHLGGMRKDFALDPKDQDWVKEQVGNIMYEFYAMGSQVTGGRDKWEGRREGERWEMGVKGVIVREKVYVRVAFLLFPSGLNFLKG